MEENELEKYRWDYTKEIRKKLEVGSLILSQPFLNDDTFNRVVCLLCAHSKEEGSFGFIINKKTDYILSDFIDEIDHLKIPIYYGGPVSNDTLYFIHDNQFNISDAKKIGENLYWGGSFEELKAALIAHDGPIKNLKFLLGYSGWDAGQLRKEIVEDSWIVSNDKIKLAYSSSKNLWKDIMKTMGDLYAHLANSPVNPDLN